jgi:adenylate cyclase
VSAPEGAAALARVRAFLQGRGVSAADLDDAERHGTLHLLVAEHVALGGAPRHTAEDVSRLTGVPLETLHRLWRAMGFPFVPYDVVAFTDGDLEATMVTAALLQDGTDLEHLVQLTRVIGGSMAKVAEAEVAATPVLRGDEGDAEAAAALLEGDGLAIAVMARQLEYVWRRQLQAAVRRAAHLRTVAPGSAAHGVEERTVGFADLVGFTAQSQQLSEDALAALVSRFEAVAHDLVVSHGGRVVKMIGDEVMFTVDEPGEAVALGLDLAAAYAQDDVLSDVRVGIATGPVLARDGDVYGATVNLAHRIVNVARPGSVVAADETYAALEGDVRFAWRHLRGRFLKDIGRVPLHVARFASDPEPLADRARRVGEERLRDLLVPDVARERLEERVRRR